MTDRTGPTFSAALVALVALLAAASACGSATVLSSGAPAGTRGPQATLVVPGADEMLRGGAVASTPWLDPPGAPAGIDADITYPDAGAATTAFTSALKAVYAGSASQPVLDVDVVEEDGDGSVVLVSETGLADDAVAGIQYLLVLAHDGEGWRIVDIWTRALCLRALGAEGLCA